MKQKIVIQVSKHCDKCRKKALKIAAAADGVTSVALDGPEKDQLLIVGDGVDAVCLTYSLRKKLCHASLETVEEVKEKKVEPNPVPEPKPETPIVCCRPCPPQLEYYTVVADPHPSLCPIF